MSTPDPARPSPPLHLALTLLGVVLAAAALAVVVLLHAGPNTAFPAIYAFPGIAVLFAATGLLAWWRRPTNRIGPLLTWCGATWLAASLGNTAVPLLIAVGTVTAVLPAAIVLHLVLVAPTGRASDRATRVTVGLAYVLGTVLQFPLYAFVAAGPPYDLVVVADRPDLARLGERVQNVAGALVVLAIVVLSVRRLREYEREQRRVLAPLFLYGIVAVVAIPLVANVLRPLLELSPQRTVVLQLAAVATVPLAFLAVVLRGGFARTGELSAFVTSVASSADSRDDLQRAVASTLGDPSATVLRWSGADATYRDASGAVVALPSGDDHRAVVQVDVEGRRVGVVVYDDRLNTDPSAVAAVGRVAAIALDRQGLLEDVSASRRALREASSRVLDEGDRERRRIARDLHDGLQVSLVRLSMQAHRLAQEPPDEATTALAARLASEVDDAAAGLRALVQGVMPPPLVERGLATAVQELAYDLPIRITVDVEGVPAELSAPVETTAYFVVAEALTNVLKHAQASAVQLSLRADGQVLAVDVVDDGRGGARTETRGTGLAGLRDRIDVLGGTFTVDSSSAGTRVRAVLPCA